MIIDSSELTSNTNIESDVCIIGAGAAGISIAQSFFGTSVSVALLEGGGMEFDSASQEIYKGERRGIPYPDLETSRARYFGGTTNYWAGHVRPLKESDFEAKPWIGVDAWPITKSDIDPYYKQAFSYCMYGTGEFEWDKDYWANKQGITSSPLDDKHFNIIIEQVMHRLKPSFDSFGAYFKENLENSSNVTVYLNSNVTELHTNEDGSSIVLCEVYSKTGKPFSIKAKYFVVACGGIENARLLLVSNSTIKSGIGNQRGLVGRYFCDHPHSNVGRFISTKKFHSIEKLFKYNATTSGSNYIGQFLLTEDVQRKHSLSSTFIRLLPKVPHSSDGTVSAWKIMDEVKKGILPDDLLYHIGNIITEIDSLIEREYYKVTHKTPEKYFSVFQIVESVPSYNSRVLLTDEKDKFGKQRIALNYQISDIDKNTLLFGAKSFATDMGRLGLGRVQLKTELENAWPEYLWEKHHHMCTTRMASDASSGVVDKNCKVFSTNNLFIAGSSVFGSAGGAPPTLTIVALALRLADHLKGRLL